MESSSTVSFMSAIAKGLKFELLELTCGAPCLSVHQVVNVRGALRDKYCVRTYSYDMAVELMNWV